jgi:hypothetical protein
VGQGGENLPPWSQWTPQGFPGLLGA